MRATHVYCAVMVCLLAMLFPGRVFAHAFLDHAEPKVGSEVKEAPKELKIWFTQELEPDFSTIEVFDADNKRVDLKETKVDEKDHKLLIAKLGDLRAGTYRVAWRVVSTDTHKTHGDFKFTIKP